AVIGADHFIAFKLKIVAQARDHCRFVLDDQDAGLLIRAHRGFPSFRVPSRLPRRGFCRRKAARLGVTCAVVWSRLGEFRLHVVSLCCAYCVAANGNDRMNLLPLPGVLSTSTSPPCARVMCRTSDSPRPLPFVLCTRGSPVR